MQEHRRESQLLAPTAKLRGEWGRQRFGEEVRPRDANPGQYLAGNQKLPSQKSQAASQHGAIDTQLEVNCPPFDSQTFFKKKSSPIRDDSTKRGKAAFGNKILEFRLLGLRTSENSVDPSGTLLGKREKLSRGSESWK